MAFDNAQRLQSLGVPGPLARELRDQITANVGNAARLRELGMVRVATYVANSITTGPMVAKQAVARGMPPDVAVVLTAMVNA